MSDYGYPENELEDSLRRAFVDHRCDYIVLDNRRERFLMESAGLGEERGWLTLELKQYDEQSSALEGRLTEAGRRHFGVAK